MSKMLESTFYGLYVLLALLLIFSGLSIMFFGDKADMGAAIVMWILSGVAGWLLIEQKTQLQTRVSTGAGKKGPPPISGPRK